MVTSSVQREPQAPTLAGLPTPYDLAELAQPEPLLDLRPQLVTDLTWQVAQLDPYPLDLDIDGYGMPVIRVIGLRDQVQPAARPGPQPARPVLGQLRIELGQLLDRALPYLE